MLLQSHAGVVHLLPALPSAVPNGKVTGLVARGNFVVDMEWSGGKLTWARVTARAGGILAIRVQDGREFSVNDTVYREEISTAKGYIYEISPL